MKKKKNCAQQKSFTSQFFHFLHSSKLLIFILSEKQRKLFKAFRKRINDKRNIP